MISEGRAAGDVQPAEVTYGHRVRDAGEARAQTARGTVLKSGENNTGRVLQVIVL